MSDYYNKIIKEMLRADLEDIIHVQKEDGRYKIIAVSTAQIKDGEGETFTTKAMDYDAALAERTGKYPEFRMFHKKGLGIGKVTKMSRVGIFAVDEGYSYDDPFSLHVVEKMLIDNDGSWKVSRGFEVHEMSGGCLNCGEGLVVGLKHMIAGYKCPSCNKVYIMYKGVDGDTPRVLDEPHFLKTRTFDITVTDIPAVPMTGVSAFYNMEYAMDKKQLRKKLLDAGLDEDIIDSRLESLSDAALKELKEMNDIPYATLLKELTDEEEVEDDDEEEEEDIDELEDSDEEILVLDDSVVTDVATEVVKQMKQLLENAEFTLGDIEDGFEMEFKEIPAVAELQQQVTELSETVTVIKEAVNTLLESDTKRLKQMVKKSSANGRLRVIRAKGGGTMDEEDEDEEYEDEEDEDEDRMPATTAKKKSMRRQAAEGVFVPGAGGNNAGSMTEFIQGN